MGMSTYPDRCVVRIERRRALEERPHDVGGEVRTIAQDERNVQRLFPGFDLVLFRDEAEGYYLNVTTPSASETQRAATASASARAARSSASCSRRSASRAASSPRRSDRMA